MSTPIKTTGAILSGKNVIPHLDWGQDAKDLCIEASLFKALRIRIRILESHLNISVKILEKKKDKRKVVPTLSQFLL